MKGTDEWECAVRADGHSAQAAVTQLLHALDLLHI